MLLRLFCTEFENYLKWFKPMIAESYYWKRELLRVAARLRRRLTQRRWPEASFSVVEMDLMVGFYAIRKLAEAKKISDERTWD